MPSKYVSVKNLIYISVNNTLKKKDEQRRTFLSALSILHCPPP